MIVGYVSVVCLRLDVRVLTCRYLDRAGTAMWPSTSLAFSGEHPAVPAAELCVSMRVCVFVTAISTPIDQLRKTDMAEHALEVRCPLGLWLFACGG